MFTIDLKNPLEGKAVDVGTGAGFPGLAAGIALPDLGVDLIESNGKKSRFLSAAIGELGLSNVRVLCERSETLARNSEFRESYDFGFSRALAKPPVALELVLPFLKRGGQAFFWASGPDWAAMDSIGRVARSLGGSLAQESEYLLPEDEKKISRRIVRIEKTAATPAQYPRRVGMPQKKPLH